MAAGNRRVRRRLPSTDRHRIRLQEQEGGCSTCTSKLSVSAEPWAFALMGQDTPFVRRLAGIPPGAALLGEGVVDLRRRRGHRLGLRAGRMLVLASSCSYARAQSGSEYEGTYWARALADDLVQAAIHGQLLVRKQASTLLSVVGGGQKSCCSWLVEEGCPARRISGNSSGRVSCAGRHIPAPSAPLDTNNNLLMFFRSSQ